MQYKKKKRFLKHVPRVLLSLAITAAGLCGNAMAAEEANNIVTSDIIRSYNGYARFSNPFSVANLFIENSMNIITTLTDKIFTTPIIVPFSLMVDPIKTSSVRQGLFGTVSVPFSAIAVRGQWNRVRSNNLSEVDLCSFKKCNPRANILVMAATRGKAQAFASKLATANSAVNSVIKYQSDQKIYGRSDYWATAAETIARGAGDCEDFAILKHTMLRTMGVPDKSLTIVVLRDNSRNLYHAVLGVSTNQGNFILDNVRDQIARDNQIPYYQPLFSFSGTRSWIHGTQTTSSSPNETTQETTAKIAPNASGTIPPLSISEQSLPLSELRASIQ